MATLTIKNVPDELHRKLKERARRHRRSMNNEAIVCLEQMVLPGRQRDADVLIAEAEALNRSIGKTLPDVVNEAKQEGRD